MKKSVQAFLVILSFLLIVACSKEDTPDENSSPDQFPASGILYSGNMHIYVLNVDGSNPRKISRSNENYFEDYPSSSPDGKKIVFRRDWKGIVVQDASGEKIILNDENRPFRTTWSDNSTIFYSRYNGMVSNGKTYVYSVKLNLCYECRWIR